jgi:FtsZ-binding cell division protein ZapB
MQLPVHSLQEMQTMTDTTASLQLLIETLRRRNEELSELVVNLRAEIMRLEAEARTPD